MSKELWNDPEKFSPERFLVDNRLVKPDHFLPFGGGRRSCMGYKMVQLISVGILSSILQKFTVLPIHRQNYEIPIGTLSVPKSTFEFKFAARQIVIEWNIFRPFYMKLWRSIMLECKICAVILLFYKLHNVSINLFYLITIVVFSILLNAK